MGFSGKFNSLVLLLVLGITLPSSAFAAPLSSETIAPDPTGNLGTIKGVVRDQGGLPISEASVAIFRVGTSRLLKQVVSGSDGRFIAKILPGTYTVLAVAQGFNPVTLFGVEVGRASELTYGFSLERAGGGNTLPEKRADRNSSRWRIRAAQAGRSIYQTREGEGGLPESVEAAVAIVAEEAPGERKGQTVVETVVAGGERGQHVGVNFATLLPVTEDSDVTFAAQIARGKNAPQRFETSIRVSPFENHQFRFTGSLAKIGNVATDRDAPLGQVSFQALDEWKIRGGVIFVVGLDYSKFLGASSDSAISPRLGLQYDLNSKTRLRSAYTSQVEEKSWARAIELEGQSIAFIEPLAVEDLAHADGKPLMNKSRRLEFGIERIIDSRSSVDANVFFDTSLSRGVGLNSFAFDTLDPNGFGEFVANQQGRAQGARVVYSRRLGGVFSANAGYAFGTGQRLAISGLSDPSRIFENDLFHSFFGQVAADLASGTSIRTIYRLSPEATVFAIDPFKGSLAIFDPGLSVLLTQNLPTLGLPFRAQAMIDARNVFDLQSMLTGDLGTLRLTGNRRALRGGIQVRF